MVWQRILIQRKGKLHLHFQARRFKVQIFLNLTGKYVFSIFGHHGVRHVEQKRQYFKNLPLPSLMFNSLACLLEIIWSLLAPS
jgi:hypothetical protein